MRRSLAVFLIVLLLPLFLVSLVVLRVNDTALAADFYIDQLRKTDIFTFLYDEAIPAALDEMNQEQDLPVNLDVVQAELLSSLREVLPPEWLQEQTELSIAEVVPYLEGDTDSFAITIPLADRLEALGDVLKRELGGGDTYDLIFDEVVAPLLEESLDENSVGDLPLGITIASQDIVAAVQEVMPPQWIQARVEHLLDQVVPYLTGRSEHFAVHVPLADRLEVLAPVIKELLVRSNAYNVFSSQDFADAVDEQLGEFGELPFGVQLSSDQLVGVIRDVAPPEWIQARVESALDQMLPYATGKQDGFEIVVPLKDRVQVAVPALKQLLRDADAYNLIFDQVIATMVGENIGELAELPFGVTIAADEIVPALREVLPPEFIQEQAENMLDEFMPYLIGDAEGFRVVVPLADRKEAALRVIDDLANRKLEELLANLPQCTLTEALGLAQEGFTGLVPSCVPAGFSLEEIKQELGIDVPGITEEQIEEQLGIDLTLVTEGVTLDRIKEEFGIDVAGQVSQMIGEALPDEFAFTDADLRDTLGPEDEETLDQVLGWARNGYTYTDADLRDDLAGEDGDTSTVETLDRVLDWTRNGYTYTDADLRDDLAGEDGDTSNLETLDQALEWTSEGFAFTDADLRDLVTDDGQNLQAVQDIEQFDRIRGWLGLGRSLWVLLLLVPGVILAGIGFLGGRRWPSRVMWAAVPLGIAGGIAYAAFGPVYLGVAEPFVDDRLAEATRDATGAAAVVSDKGVAIAKTVLGDFVSGLAGSALLFLVVGVFGVALAILWPTISRLAGGGPAVPGQEGGAPAEPVQEEGEQEEPEPAEPGQGLPNPLSRPPV